MAFIAILAAFSIGKRYVSQEIAGKAIDRIYFRPLRLPAWQHHPAKPFLAFNTMSGTENPHQKKDGQPVSAVFIALFQELRLSTSPSRLLYG